ncbi:MAG: hypothetical protein RIM99_19965 [Cyclobacteriaceae bacterium]
MLIEEKYFSQDKNHLLKAVQAFAKESLLNEWVHQLFVSYNQQHNPMGLEDDFIIQLKNSIDKSKELMEEHYDLLAAIYRLNHSDNQLEFQWDGRSHMETYDEEWKLMYRKWLVTLCSIKEIQRPLIKYSTQGIGFNNDFLKSSIRRAVLGHFNLKLRAQKLSSISA